MKKLGVAVFGILGLTLLSATSALAQSNIPEPDVLGDVVAPPGADVVVAPGAGPGVARGMLTRSPCA